MQFENKIKVKMFVMVQGRMQQLYRSLLKQKYPIGAAREFLATCEGVEKSKLALLVSYFQASAKMKAIQETYYPTMTLAGEELVKKAANRVGLEPPKKVVV